VTQPETPTPAPTPPGEEKTSGTAAATEATAVAPGELKLRLFARTDVGQIREHNEDNFLVADLTKRARGLLESNRQSVVGAHGNLFAVCDGMGGAAAGEIASQLAVDIIYEKMVEGLEKKPAVDRDELARRLVRAVETAGFRIFQEAKADRSRRGMGTTVTAAALVDDHLFFAQVGDSRGYLLRDGILTQVTRDQSLVNQLIEAGQLTAEEAETFEHNNIILQALGTSDTVQVDLTYARVQKGDMMLLCSDGLSGMVRFDEIREAMRATTEPVEICKSLTEKANQAGGHDNITVIIVCFDGEALQSHAESDEPLKYRKYPLPEEPADNTERLRRSQLEQTADEGDPTVPRMLPGDDPGAPDDGHRGGAQGRSDGWHEQGPHHAPHEGDDRIDIPGTHVPAWVVVAIVLGVVAILAASSFFLLRG
jgi:serine/threonine protein phosphatase PrpC